MYDITNHTGMTHIIRGYHRVIFGLLAYDSLSG